MTDSIRTAVRKGDLKTSARVGGVIAAVAAVGFATAACGSDDAADSTSATSADAAGSSSTAHESGTASGAYRNGTYSATGHYNTPGGEQQIGVTVTLDNSKITKVDLDRSKTKGTSSEYQAKFASGIDSEVVGKSIDELDVSKVSGSSLTSGGFNDAIDQIKSEARS